jgi:uncharacterized membrane protein
MSNQISHTAYGDAPLSAAKNPNPGAASSAAAQGEQAQGDVLVGRSVTINRPREELYSFWRDFANLPRFMHNVHSVSIQDQTRSHWVIEAPAGATVEWDSEITRDVPGSLIAWRSLEGASVRNSGQVEFLDSPDDRGTVVRVTLTYDPPAGAVGKVIAKLFQKEPKVQARQDLRRFKQLMETGEVSTAQPPDVAPRAYTRFFAAAATVNSVMGKLFGVCAFTRAWRSRDFLNEVGAALESINLVYAQEIPGCSPGRTLDEALVWKEQAQLQRYVDAQHAQRPQYWASTLSELNQLLNERCVALPFSLWSEGSARLTRVLLEVRRHLGARLDFATQAHRICIGHRLIEDIRADV